MATLDDIGSSLGKIPSGVGILTSKNGAEESAMLASWFQQAAFDPPMITVAVNKERPIQTLIETSKKFCVNVLHTNQKDLFSHFARGFEPGVNPFDGVTIERRATDCAVITDAMNYLDCELVGSVDAGDHIVYLGRVVDAGVLNDGKSMVHTRSNGFRY